VGLPGIRHSIGLARWWHLGTDTLWLLNGLVYYVLLFATPRWHRLVPTSWDVFPNALSVLIQYLSLNWPAETGWVAYNSLQQMAYFITVFVAAPRAHHRPRHVTRAVHPLQADQQGPQHPGSAFTALHGAGLVPGVHRHSHHPGVHHRPAAQPQSHLRRAERRQLGWFLDLCGLHGGGHRRLGGGDSVHLPSPTGGAAGRLRADRPGAASLRACRLHPGEYTEQDISPYFWHNGQYPTSEEYKALFAGNFADYRLRINGLVDNPVDLDLEQLRALPHHEQITQHFCIQGWSGVARWGGVSMQTIMDLVKPRPEAQWVVFYSSVTALTRASTTTHTPSDRWVTT
jgi:hypothetical protein